MAASESTAASQLVNAQSQTMEAAPSTQARMSASRSLTSPVTSGRSFVRFISRSMSRSR